ncbi:hypothetical protein AGMMS49574_25060 [Bacteroidia bacterium]|nr:hypothetical protein AGMMS49574_25060 [Bacteroidia bacterium]
MKKIIFISTLFFLFSCSNNTQNNNNAKNQAKPQEKQLNISILLDLSDRISPTKYPATPQHFERDIEIVKTVTEYFKLNIKKLGAYKAKGKVRIFFNPAPSSSTINEIAEILNIDCSKLNDDGRNNVYNTITEIFVTNLSEIYTQTIKTSDWVGSDIWRFFKDDVKDYCIENDNNYRNILIILTDGYIYHANSKYQDSNRYSYLLEKNIKKYRTTNHEQLIEKDDFGLITKQNDLQDLEILVLEINAENNHNKIDEDITKFTLGNWFKEMNVYKYQIFSSDLPANTRVRIENFLNN